MYDVAGRDKELRMRHASRGGDLMDDARPLRPRAGSDGCSFIFCCLRTSEGGRGEQVEEVNDPFSTFSPYYSIFSTAE